MLFQQAPPPMALSPEREDLTGVVSEPKQLAQDDEMVSMFGPPFKISPFSAMRFGSNYVIFLKLKEIVMKVEEKVEKTIKKEAVGEGIVEKKTEIMGERDEARVLDFDTEHEISNGSSTKLQQQGQKHQSSPKASVIPKEEKISNPTFYLDFLV